MIKKQAKGERGITLVSLAVAIAVLIILANVIIYNMKDHIEVANLRQMQSDIENLSDKIAAYYSQNGKIPASINYTNIQEIEKAGVISDKVDTGRFLVIDLSVIENLTLNKGKDFEKVKTLVNSDYNIEVNNYKDLYIINETSHNIFYVAGVPSNEQIYYTNYTKEGIDTSSVDLRYVDGVKIPKGFHYVIGTKELGGILIRNEDDSKTYQWIEVSEDITKLPDNITIQQKEEEDFIKSANLYHGYYKSKESNEVMYFGLENWSPVYDVESIYQDKNGDIAYIPAGFQVSKTPEKNSIDKGLVVKDSKENEWVWIEVPKSIYKTAKSNEDYENIEKDMQIYVSSYRDDNYKDTWYAEEQHGFANEVQYNEWKNSMLKSVYDRGGFYIGRYEVGTQVLRSSDSTQLTQPVIQKDAYPYNYVTCKQAQEQAKTLAINEKTSSLMFGIQWDLVLKFIEEKRGKTQEELTIDSSTWGNCPKADFSVIKGKYSNNDGNHYLDVETKYNKLNTSILLTTGVTNRNHVLNIYDITGNVSEFVLEEEATSHLVSVRGSNYKDSELSCLAIQRNSVDFSDSKSNYGFRPSLW